MEQAWVWIYKTADGEAHDLFMDQGKSSASRSSILSYWFQYVIKLKFLISGEEIRFRVVKEIFTETPLPPEPNASNAPNASTLPSTSRDVDGKPETNNVAPYILHVNTFMNFQCYINQHVHTQF